MRYPRFIAFFALLLVLGCRALRPRADFDEYPFYPRTSGRSSSSSSGGSPPTRGEETGMLVGHATRIPPSPTLTLHSTQSHPGHPIQSTQAHLPHQGHPTQPQFSHQSHVALPKFDHPTHSHPAHFAQQVRLPQTHQAVGLGHSAQLRLSQSASNLRAHATSTTHSPVLTTSRMGALGASLRSPPPAGPKRGGNWSKESKDAACATARAARQPTQKWWQKAGGRPRRPDGTGPYYETNKKWREKKKQLKLEGQQKDEHPSKHQPPKGGGPGSPGTGSHAVSKRCL